MPAESDPAPLTADRTPSPEPLPPDQASSAAANATPRPAVESPTEPATADTEIPGETERRVREEQGRAAGRNIPAASGGAGDAAEADSSTTLVEEASPTSGPQTEHQAAEDRVDAAATLPAVAAGAPDPEEEASAAPTTVEARGEILEEDLLAPGPAGDASPAREVQDPAGADEAPSVPASAEEKTASDPMASVTADQHAAPPDEAAPLAPIESVRVAENALQKKVAFIGFFSRAANIDAQTMADLQAYVWPVLESECDKNLVIVRRGDADYPGALDSLVRDPFGRMNSFELVTLSRFSGLNAVVAGTVIDIRIANAISGILWYKSPEGQLRVTILVEVFDAETGTKLLDRTYVREEEVNELEPGADGRLRREDLPILEATLTSMAEEIGDDVCDALEDQPWRAFVSGISGKRITLSAGQGAGLKPGNMLGVYNSQIIDGLNNQQFFLTGERVGRIQLINVHPNRSEAILVEGQGVRDYSVAMPD